MPTVLLRHIFASLWQYRYRDNEYSELLGTHLQSVDPMMVPTKQINGNFRGKKQIDRQSKSG